MASSTENVKLGVCTVLFDGNDLGYTKGGVEVEVATTTHEVKVDQFGETPISELITGRTVTVKTPLAETTLENLVAIMPGSELITDGAKASAEIMFGAVPANGDTVTIDDIVFKFVTKASTDPNTVLVTADADQTILDLANLINETNVTVVASTTGNILNLTAKEMGEKPVTKVKTSNSAFVISPFTGGKDPTNAAVQVTSGININLLEVAKTLVLRPLGTNGEDDFTVYRAACPGALNFAYQTDNERVYQADFKGYAREDGKLFAVGKDK